MCSYVDEQRWLRHYETHKEDYEYKLVGIKIIFNIPFLDVKQNKNCKKYCLFNFIPIVEISQVEGFENE